jgi:Ala-tRNA(Pro) deacylase
VFFEAGDHQQLVHMSSDQFADLMAGAEQGHFSRRMM